MTTEFNPETVERKVLLDRFNWDVQFPCVAASDYDQLLLLYREAKDDLSFHSDKGGLR